MREILFRAKRKDNSEWVYGGFCETPPPPGCFAGEEEPPTYQIVLEKPNSTPDWNMPRQMCIMDVIPETIGQYIGMKDKNGKKIFEGDVVTVTCYSYTEAEDVFYGEVVMGGLLGTGLRYKDYCGKEKAYPLWDLAGSYYTEYIVDGNIHDTPDLLKGASKDGMD